MVESNVKDWQKVIDQAEEQAKQKKEQQLNEEALLTDEEILDFINANSVDDDDDENVDQDQINRSTRYNQNDDDKDDGYDNNNDDQDNEDDDELFSFNNNLNNLNNDIGLNILENPKYKELSVKLKDAEALATKYWNNVLSMKAELENYQRRADRDLANARKYGVEKIASSLLGIIDNLERCIDSKRTIKDKNILELDVVGNLYVGVELTLKMFMEVLQKFEIKALNPIGELFNYQYHNAIQTQEDENTEANTVLKVIQKGYILKDKLLRPAMVVVSKKPAMQMSDYE